MQKTTHSISMNTFSLRAIQFVTLPLALIVGTIWIAPSGYTSSQSAPVSAAKASPFSRPAHVNARSRSISSPTRQTIPEVWSSNGPEGKVLSLAMDPTNSAILYAAAEDGLFGLFKSTNSGASWTSVNRDVTSLFPNALVIAPSNPNVIYAGRGPIGIRSTDGGASWLYWEVGWFAAEGSSSLAIDPGNPNT